MPVARALGSDVDYRQPSWEWYHFLRLDLGSLLSAGFLYEYATTASLAAGASEVIEFSTGSHDVLLASTRIMSPGARAQGAADYVIERWPDVLIEWYSGGTVTPGAPITGLPRNHSVQQAEPFASITGGATVTVPGVKLSEFMLAGSEDRRAITAGEGGGFVHAPSQGYYLTFTNQDVDLATIYIGLLFARLE